MKDWSSVLREEKGKLIVQGTQVTRLAAVHIRINGGRMVWNINISTTVWVGVSLAFNIEPSKLTTPSQTKFGGGPKKEPQGTAPFWAWKCANPNELDLAEVQIQVNHVAKETFDFDQGTRKYGHILFGQSICLPPRNSYLVAIQELAARACLLVFCKLLQTFW